MLNSISPIDGRYGNSTSALQAYFSERALIRYRVYVEVEYFKSLATVLPQMSQIDKSVFAKLDDLVQSFSYDDAQRIKDIERTTNHDVKAVEYFLKEKCEHLGLHDYLEFIHFGLTSQDINNTTFPIMLMEAKNHVILPAFVSLIDRLKNMSQEYKNQPMLARTHGQPASPTTLGKEIYVYVERLEDALHELNVILLKGKFGGATGNFNAHVLTYPEINWTEFSNQFCLSLGIGRYKTTTQIAHYDDYAKFFHAFTRINTILIDYCRDMWTYISMDYFKQKTMKGEIGSSAMPHKVNPIDFENAEGNLGMANAIFTFLAEKLPISRLQRDLTDSTVLRNVGVPFGHTLIAIQSLARGNDKLLLNQAKLNEDLDNNWAVVAEGIQSVLRRENYPKPYEALKDLTRGKSTITKGDIHSFINSLNVDNRIKSLLKEITPLNYVGTAANFDE